jgi:thymidylate kinase
MAPAPLSGGAVARWPSRDAHGANRSHAPRRGGLMVAFVGVDGAGKSSVIDALCDDPSLRGAGIKRLYFGSNEYWIPGALWLHGVLKPVPLLKYLPTFLLLADRQLRLLAALYHRRAGRLVVCDRFYYDDLVMRRLLKTRVDARSASQRVAYRIKAFCRPRMWRHPDLTIFLDVDPDVAYRRKQDYPFALMCETNALYREVMASFAEVVVVNANQPRAEVERAVHDQLRRLGQHA